MALVLFAVALGIGEPLACILHCPLWASVLPAGLPGHAHHGHHVVASEQNVPVVLPPTTSRVSTPQELGCHVLLGGGISDGLSGNMMPQPEHLGAMLMLGLTLVVAAQLRRRAPVTQPAFLPLARPPDLRPPIAFAY